MYPYLIRCKGVVHVGRRISVYQYSMHQEHTFVIYFGKFYLAVINFECLGCLVNLCTGFYYPKRRQGFDFFDPTKHTKPQISRRCHLSIDALTNGYLLYVGDFTTQLYGDYKHPHEVPQNMPCTILRSNLMAGRNWSLLVFFHLFHTILQWRGRSQRGGKIPPSSLWFFVWERVAETSISRREEICTPFCSKSYFLC